MRKIFLTVAFIFFLFPVTILAADCTIVGCTDPQLICDQATGQCTSPRRAVTASSTSNDCDNPEDADTALGCIPTEPAELVKWILKYAILMGGGIAFLLSVWGGATILLSAGNPEKINEGRDIIVSAISGLLFIVFSVFLLRLIGVDILGIPGFTSQ